jgi:chemotaxis protein methyltransferase CheR
MPVATPSSLAPAPLAEFGRVARERAGLCLDRLPAGLIESRLAERMGALGMETLDLYLRFLTSGPYQGEEFEEILGLLCGEGCGLHEPLPQFDALSRWVLPRVLDARKRSRRLRIWSAGCGSGCEAYTIAALVRRELGVRAADWRIEILGTDMRSNAIETAAAGRYPVSAGLHLPADLRRTCFIETGDTLTADPILREMVHFERHNLLDRAGARRHGVWDVIFCRGILGTMTPACAERTIDTLTGQLAAEGYLFVGAGESLDAMDTGLRPIPLPCGGYQSHSDSSEVRP